MDPVFFAFGGTVLGGVGLKMIEKKVKSSKETMIEVSYYTPDGERKTKSVKAYKDKRESDIFDEEGHRVGYSAHYTRMLEIKSSGLAVTPCHCEDCEAEEEAERERERQRQWELERIEQERREEKRRRQREKEEREARERRARELAEQHEKMMNDFDAGKYDHLSVRQLIKQGIPKDEIVARLDGQIVWPEYAIKGTDEVTYEKQEISRKPVTEYDGYNVPTAQSYEAEYKYFQITRTYFPNGEMKFNRVEIDRDHFMSVAPAKMTANEINRKSQMLKREPVDRDFIHETLKANKNRNDQYMEYLKETQRLETALDRIIESEGIRK